ncbi:helix-turn-helix domain-containing protein [Nonomuraea fuscirosea]|jgi:DNA-binding HxlR family transcriptional regulator|uniref:winged helix-turn-helix transcriptional regulator n=1 Tax=Nonomuraea fuscirosea TaxID=1291556 RepID=UPI002DDA5461|nr:helix-turn-helix domain-containing protein [Nonomuraea fuscirosea]WSA53711.1 helix-turn-helix transcriptional regulator [Nonomuraea fuscirosea]
MASREYGQFCGLARAMEMVGERWTMLIIRNLLTGAQRFTDLHKGLPSIPTNILSARLRQLEETGLATRRALPHPERAVVYELTDYGRDLEPALIALGRWGARTLSEPRPGEIITAESIAMSFRTTYRPEAARGVTAGYEIRMGDFTFRLQITDGELAVGIGPHPAPGLVIERLAGFPVRELMSGDKTPDELLRTGSMRIEGDPTLLGRFTEMFRF